MGNSNRLASLQSRADAGDSHAVFEIGKLLDGGDLGARDWCETAAERNYAEAMCLLGNFHRKLNPPDLMAAREWYEKAAEAEEVCPAEGGGYRYFGRRYAMDWLGRLFEELWSPPDLAAAQAWYERAAAAGSAGAMSRLGELAERRDPPDLAAARAWYEKAADAGGASDQYDLAEFLANRCDPPDLSAARQWYEQVNDDTGDYVSAFKLGVLFEALMDPPDLPAARQWYERAIREGGYEDAEYNLAVLLETRWEPRDLPAAKSMYTLAALSHHAGALRRLAGLFGHAVNSPDFSAAQLEWETKAQTGDADAAYLLGVLNQSGLLHSTDRKYRPRDLITALAWYRKAAEAGNIDAMVRLGQLLSGGYKNVPQDLLEARAWLEKAVTSGDADAMYELGWLLQSDRVPRDIATSQEWFRKAAAAGNIRAQNEIE
jgi:TPR repeat protein